MKSDYGGLHHEGDVCGGRDFGSPARSGVHWCSPSEDSYHELMQAVRQARISSRGSGLPIKPGIKRYVCKAEWGAHGRAGGPMRNQRMIEWEAGCCHGIPRRRGRGYGAARRQSRDHRSGWRQIRDRLS